MEGPSLGPYSQAYLTPEILLGEGRNWLGFDVEDCGMNLVDLLASKKATGVFLKQT